MSEITMFKRKGPLILCPTSNTILDWMTKLGLCMQLKFYQETDLNSFTECSVFKPQQKS